MDYSEPCQYSVRLIEKLKSLDTKNILDFDLINKAICWAKKYHGDQKRKSGEPYYSHPLEVAYMVSEHKLKTDVIVASILHDIIEATEVTAGMIIDNFSWRIAQMVDMLTRDRPDGTKLTIEEVITNAYKKDDKEVLLIKLIDRLHNIKTISSILINKQEKIVIQTINEFLILCQYLELPKVLCDLFNASSINLTSVGFSLQKERNFFSNSFQQIPLIFENEKYLNCTQ